MVAEFYHQKASEKLTPRISHWQQITGLTPKDIQSRELKKSWGSYTPGTIAGSAAKWLNTCPHTKSWKPLSTG